MPKCLLVLTTIILSHLLAAQTPVLVDIEMASPSSTSTRWVTEYSGGLYIEGTFPGSGSGLIRMSPGIPTPIPAVPNTSISTIAWDVVVNGILYFSANTLYGQELLKFDGNTLTLVDIEPGPGSSNPRDLVDVAGVLYFSATTTANGSELYRYDGTTLTMIEIQAGSAGSGPFDLRVAGTRVYCRATESSVGSEVFMCQGTTVTPIDVESGPIGSNPADLVIYNGSLFFSAHSSATGSELWQHNGTTLMAREVTPGPTGSSVDHLTVAANRLYFIATTLALGSELYYFTGTALTVVDVFPGVTSSSPNHLTNHAGILYFAATSSTLGNELHTHDGSTLMAIDVRPGPTGSFPNALLSTSNRIYFKANPTPAGTDLVFSDGVTASALGIPNVSVSQATAAGGNFYFRIPNGSGVELGFHDGTTLSVLDIEPGADGSDPQPLADIGGTLYFAATTTLHGRELHSHDGVSLALHDPLSSQGSSDPQELTAIGNTLWLSASRIQGQFPRRTPYAHDGLTLFAPSLTSPPISVIPKMFTASGSNVFFVGSNGTGNELWKYDGSTFTFYDINPGIQGSDPDNLIDVSGILYFTAATPTSGRELYKHDGTTLTLIEINPGMVGGGIAGLTNFGGMLYFSANTPANGIELYKYDGSSLTLIDIEPGSGGSNPHSLTEHNGLLYLAATTTAEGTEPRIYDGTTWTTIDVEPGAGSSTPSDFTSIGSDIFFTASTVANGIKELYRYSGTTLTLIELNPGPANAGAEQLTAVNGRLYLTGFNPEKELYMFDGTLHRYDVNPGAFSSQPALLTAVGNLLYFRALTSTDGIELFMHDGSTLTLIDVASGSADSIPDSLTALGGVVYFSAETPSGGREMHRHDGSVLTSFDIEPGAGSSDPQWLTPVGARLYFSAATLASGRELHFLLAPNTAPAFTSMPPLAAQEGSTYTYNVAVDDISQPPQTLTIAASTLPGWLMFTDHGNRTGTLTGIPGATDIGTHNVVLEVSDGVAPPVPQAFSIVVSEINTPPFFLSSPPTSAFEASPYIYDISVDDTNMPAQPLTISGATLPGWLSLVDHGNRTGRLSGTPGASDAGTHSVVLEVDDGLGAPVSQIFMVTVVANTAPGFTSTPVTTAIDGTLYSYAIVAGDPDTPSQPLTITGAVLPAWLMLSDHGNRTATLSGTPGPADIGTHLVTIEVTDGLAPPVPQSFSIAVGANTPPTFSSMPGVTATEAENYTYPVTVHDPDAPPQVLAITATALPAWLILTDHGNGTATLAGIPGNADVGSHNFTLAASDGVASPTLQPISITVKKRLSGDSGGSEGSGCLSQPRTTSAGLALILAFALAGVVRAYRRHQ